MNDFNSNNFAVQVIASGSFADQPVYGDPEMAVMAYNCGPSGARALWNAGTYHTAHSIKVMDRFNYWTSVLEG